MTNETRRIIRDALGAIEVELRQQRHARKGELAEISRKLDVLIRMVGGHDAKIQAVREDHDALSGQVADHERRLASLAR